MLYNIGIDLGGSHIAIGVVNSNGKILEKRITSVEKKNIKKSIEQYIIENVNKMQTKYKIKSIGIAVPGTVRDSKIIKSVNLGILKEYDILEAIKKQINLPMTIRNDAKCAALAEHKFGSLRDYNRTIFLTLGTGIGGAAIIDNNLLDTGSLPGCEFGHMIVEKDGKFCKCGKFGCLEAYSSMKVLKNNIRKVLGVDETTRGEELLDIIRKNNKNNEHYKEIENTINEFIEYLAIGISNLINIFEPEAIGIGGSFVYFQDVLLDRLKDYIQKENLNFNKRKEVIIMPAVLGNDAGIIGAVL